MSGSDPHAQESWWQHFLPQFYLRGFGDSRKRIRRYERDGQQRHSIAAIRGVAAELGFYTLVDERGNRSQAADDLLTRVEDGGAKALRRITESFPPSRPHKVLIARFIAFQMLRTPESRRQQDLMAEKLVEILGNAQATEELISSISTPSTEDQIRLMLNVAPLLAAPLVSKTWVLVRARDSAFVTSDSSAAVWSPHVEGRLTGIGVENADEIHFPVDRRHSLVLLQRGQGPEGVLIASPERVHEMNRMYAYESHRWIFQHPDDDVLGPDILPSGARPLTEINQELIFDKS